MILSDTPRTSADQDHLNFRPYSNALATIIDHKATSTPLITAISGPWGAGKTTLSELVQRQLEAIGAWDDPHIICRFNAWKHDDAPHLGTAFAAEVAQSVNRYRHWWRRLIQPLPATMLTPEQRWRRKCYLIIGALALAFGLVLGTKTRNLIVAASHPTTANWTAAEHAVHGWAASVLVLLAAVIFIYPKILSGTQSVARFITDPQSEAALGSMHSVREQLGKHIHSATRRNRRLIIFVDDLERCRPPRAVEVCEVASQLLDHHDVIVVLVGDMQTIAKSAALKYRDLEHPAAEPAGSLSDVSYVQYGRAYLQKIVTIQFELPPATPGQLEEMLGAGEQDVSEDKRVHLSKRALAGIFLYALIPTGFIAFGVWSVIRSSDIIGSLIAVAAGGLVGTILGVVPSRLRRNRTRATRKRVDEEIQKQSVGTTADQAAQNISQTDADNVRQRYLSALLDTPAITNHAVDLVFKFLPDRPRAAKRLLNQVRLMLLIAADRGLLILRSAHDQSGQVKRIARWLVLRERWPDVASVLEQDPQLVKELAGFSNNLSKDILQDRLHLGRIADADKLLELLLMEPRFEDLSDLIAFSGTTLEPADRPAGGNTGNSAEVNSAGPNLLADRHD